MGRLAPQMRNARAGWSAAWPVVAALLLWGVLVSPYRYTDLHPAALLRLPLEGLLLALLLLAVPARVHRPVAAIVGLVLALLFILKVLNLGFYVALNRPFDALSDVGYTPGAVSLLFESVGTGDGVITVALAVLGAIAVLVLLPLAAVRVSAALTAHRALAAGGVTALLGLWLGLAVSGASSGAGAVASSPDVHLAIDQTRLIAGQIRDEQVFDRQLVADPRGAASAGATTLAGLRGKNVLLVFVESYGRFALEGPSSGPVTAALDTGTRQLEEAGFHARSAFLTSPTFGGTSWLAHSTLQSGLWIDSQSRYDRLMASRHNSLTSIFGQAGWRTVMDMPSSPSPWPEGQWFYRFAKMYGTDDVGYTGPRFGYARIPDQYTLQALQRLELGSQPRKPVMAEVDLDSSHTPWAPLSRMVPWTEVGDGAIYDPMPGQGESESYAWSTQTRLRAAYSSSVVYTLHSLVGFLQRYRDDDLVMIVLGDHQPNTFVTGPGASHDVPVSIITRDPAVIRPIAGWGWQPGLRPRPNAPVWRMDAFRGHFLQAYDAPMPGDSTRPPAP